MGHLLRGELIISKDWSRAKCLQNKTESLLRLMEEKKKDIWNFSLNQKNQESDKVSFKHIDHLNLEIVFIFLSFSRILGHQLLLK